MAASNAGWHDKEIAACTALSAQALHKRVLAARARADGTETLPQVPAPSESTRSSAFKAAAAAGREWLTIGEAVTYTKRCNRTIANWRIAGLLPNTDEVSSTARLYLRSDLQRVLEGAIQLHGADYMSLRAQIEKDGVAPRQPPRVPTVGTDPL